MLVDGERQHTSCWKEIAPDLAGIINSAKSESLGLRSKSLWYQRLNKSSFICCKLWNIEGALLSNKLTLFGIFDFKIVMFLHICFPHLFPLLKQKRSPDCYDLALKEILLFKSTSQYVNCNRLWRCWCWKQLMREILFIFFLHSFTLLS